MDENSSALLTDAIENNVLWCDAMARLQGARTETTYDSWTSWGVSVPYYPKLITRTASSNIASDVLLKLDSDRLGHPYGLKDSYASLKDQGLRLLFESTWIGWDRLSDPGPGSAFRWNIVRDQDGLTAWARSWARSAGDTPDLALSLFLPALLAVPGVTVVASDSGLAGAVLYEHSGTTGLSNVFPSDDPAVWKSLVSFLKARGAERLVGYENGTSLDAADGAGFRRLGPLRVWLREPR